MAKSLLVCSVVCMLAAGGLSACDKAESAAIVDKGKISGAIKDDVHGLIASFNTKDAAGAVSHDAADVVSMFHGQANVVGVEGDLAMTKEQVSDPRAYVQIGNETVDIADSGEMAVYRTVYKYTSTNPKTKKDMVEHGNWLIGYKQVDGKWKIAWNVVSDTGPEPAADAKAK
jgi:ketosteroid isomerase-like protein